MKNKKSTRVYYSLIFITVAAFLCIMLRPIRGRAEEEGVKFYATGTAYPAKAMKEMKKAVQALREARAQLKRLLKKAEKAGEVPDYAVALSGRLDALNDSFNALVAERNLSQEETKKQLDQLTEDLDALKLLCMTSLKEFDKLLNLLANKEERDDKFSFGLSAYGSTDWALSKEEVMPIGGLGLSGSWKKGKLALNLTIGAGTSVVGDPALSWTFVSSLQFYLKDDFLSIGPASVLSQDLGMMEGADRLAWSAGCKVKLEVSDYSFWAVPMVGIHGERGHGDENPSYSPNLGAIIGVDYLFMK